MPIMIPQHSTESTVSELSSQISKNKKIIFGMKFLFAIRCDWFLGYDLEESLVSQLLPLQCTINPPEEVDYILCI